MAKSLKYWYEFADDLLGNTKRVEIYEEGFVGDDTELIAGSTPLSKTYNKDVGEKYLGGIVQMVVNIEANSTNEFQAINFNSPNYGDVVIRHLIDDVVQFNAILVPFEGSDIDLPSSYFNVSLGAECGLNQLKNITYTHSGTRKKVIQIIKECLSELGYVDTFPIKVIDNTQCFALGEITGVDYWETYIEDANFEGLSCLEVINQIKQVYNEIVFSDKAWFIRNVEEISRTDSNVLIYDWATLTQSSVTYLRPTETIQRTAGGQFGRLFSQQNIKVSKPKSTLANIFPEGDMNDDTGWTYAGSAGLFLVIEDGVLTNNRATFFTPTAVGADGSYIQSPLITFYPFQEWFDTKEKERLQIRGKANKGSYIKNLRFQILAQAEGQTYFLTTEGTWYTYVSGYGTPIYEKTYTDDSEFVIDIPQPPYVTSSILTSADKLSFGEFGYFNGGGDYLIPDTNIAYNLYIRVMYPERIHDEPPMSGDEVYGVELEADIDYLHVQKVDISGVVENGFNRNYGVPETKDRKIDFSVSIGVGYPSYPSGLDCLFVDSGSTDQVAYYGRYDSLTSLPIDEHIAYSYLDVLANRLSYYQGTIKGDLEFTDLVLIDDIKYRIHNLSHDSRRNMSTVKLVELDSTASTLTITPNVQLDEDTIRTINEEINKTLGTNTPLRFVDKNFEETILASGERVLKLRDDFKIRTVFSDEVFLRTASDGIITDVAEDTASDFTLTKPAETGTYATREWVGDNGWLLNGNALAAAKSIGSTTDFDIPIIRNNVTVAAINTKGMSFPLIEEGVLFEGARDFVLAGIDLADTTKQLIKVTASQAVDFLSPNFWKKGGNVLSADDTIGSTTDFDVSVIRNSVTKALFGATTTDFDAATYNFKSGGTTYVTLNSTGLGIGITSPSAKLHVSPASSLTGISTGDGLLIGNSSLTSAELILGINGSVGNIIQSRAGGAWPLLLNPFGGNVGIGTTSPSEKFHILNTNAFNRVLINNTGDNYNGIRLLRTGGTVPTDWEIFTPNSSTNLAFFNGDFRLNITSSGNVGIGTTSPSAKLTILQSSDVASQGIYLYRANGSDWTGFYKKSGLGSLNDPLVLSTNYKDDIFAIDRIGNVYIDGKLGIGTNNHTNSVSVDVENAYSLGVFRKLNVESVGDAATVFSMGAYASSVAKSGVEFYGILKADANNGSFRIRTLQSGSMVDDFTVNGGNVGIGTTSPSYKLDVTGTGHFTGSVTFDTVPSSLQDATSANHLVRYSQWIASTSIKYLPTPVLTVSLTNVTLLGVQTINGVTLIAGDRVLVMGQTVQADNGIYIVAAGVWVRATDSDSDTELRGYIINVSSGTYAGYKYINTNESTITVGTTAITYTEFSGIAEIDPVFVSWRDTTRAANTFWAAPNGSNGAATWRTLVAADVPTLNQSTTGSAATLTTARTISATSDISWSVSFDGSANVTATATLPNVNSNVGTFRSVTVNGKGLVTAATNPAIALGSEVSGILPTTNGGSGTATVFTLGSVIFAGTSGVYSQDNANFFWDDTNNRLGIGTATPTSKLHVVGTGTIMQLSSVATTSSIYQTISNPNAGTIYLGFDSSTASTFGSGHAYATVLSSSSANALVFQTNDVNRITITGDGLVGIGTSTPTEKLHVSGNIRYATLLKPNNVAGTNGQVLGTNGTQDAWVTLTTSYISNLSSYEGFDARYFTETESDTRFVALGGSYANPTWITELAWSKLSGVPSTFTPSAHTLDSHSNVTITSNSSGEILKWNGSAWINNTPDEANLVDKSNTQTIGGTKTFINTVTIGTSGSIMTAGQIGFFAGIANTSGSGAIVRGTTYSKIQIGTSDRLVVYDGGVRISAFSTNYLTAPTERLQVDGNIRYNALLKPNNIAGTNKQVLSTNGTQDIWSTLNFTYLSDVDITSLTGGDILMYDNTTSKWRNQNPSIALLLQIDNISGLQTALDDKQPLDADLTAIAALTGTSGLLRKTNTNTWTLDTTTYLTTTTADSLYQSILPSGDSGQFLVRDSTGEVNFMDLKIRPIGLSFERIGVGNTDNYLGEHPYFLLKDKRHIQISRITDSTKQFNAGMFKKSNDGFVEQIGGSLSIRATSGIYLTDFASPSRPLSMVTIDAFGKLSVGSIQGGGQVQASLTTNHVGFGINNTLASSSNLTFLSDRYFHFTNSSSNFNVGVTGQEGFVESVNGNLLLQAGGAYGVVVDQGFFRVDALAGAGNRMVAVDLNGQFFTQTIPSGGGVPALTATQIGYGDGGNLMTSSSNFVYDSGSLVLTNTTAANTNVIRINGSDGYDKNIFFSEVGLTNNGAFVGYRAGVTGNPDPTMLVLQTIDSNNIMGGIAIHRQNGHVYIGLSPNSKAWNSAELNYNKLFVDGNMGVGGNEIILSGTSFKLSLSDAFAGAYTPSNGDKCTLTYDSSKAAFVLQKMNTRLASALDGSETFLIL